MQPNFFNIYFQYLILVIVKVIRYIFMYTFLNPRVKSWVLDVKKKKKILSWVLDEKKKKENYLTIYLALISSRWCGLQL